MPTPKFISRLAKRFSRRAADVPTILPTSVVEDAAAGKSAPKVALTGMTTIEEQDYYIDAGARVAGQPGAVVDLGTWLGSTAISLVRGLQRNGKKSGGAREKVIAFDRYIWESWMDECATGVFGVYEPGESFLPETRKRTGELREHIEFVMTDLTQYSWERGPIKLLLVDAMKSWELCQKIATEFYPDLLPGSTVIHQDFKNYYVVWIHILQYRLREYFSPQHETPYSTTFAFETITPPSPEAISAAIDFDNITDAEVEEAIHYCMSLVTEGGRGSLAAAHIMYFVHRDRIDEAQRLWAIYSKKYDTKSYDFKIVKKRLAQSRAA